MMPPSWPSLALMASVLASMVIMTSASDASMFSVSGKVSPPDVKAPGWQANTRVHIDGGKKIGYLKVRIASSSL